ncbi:MAG: hypothetical protein ACXVFL_16640 [Solirubrobacteraceae bacterium]
MSWQSSGPGCRISTFVPWPRSLRASWPTRRPAAVRISAAKRSAGEPPVACTIDDIGFRHTTRSRSSPASRSRFEFEQIPPSM